MKHYIYKNLFNEKNYHKKCIIMNGKFINNLTKYFIYLFS